jgi:1,4-dihydroxy-2-naphthoate polyprenyltransferase
MAQAEAPGAGAARPVPRHLRSRGRRSRLLPYLRLAKYEFFDFYLSVPLVWTILPSDLRTDPHVLATLLVCFLALIGSVSSVMVFDDITGYLDGSDEINYAADSGGLRKRHRKPLLDGVLTVGQARRFGYTLVLAGAALWVVASATAPHRPAWAVATISIGFFAAVQYSWGLRFSYHGWAEVLIAVTPMCIVAGPYGLLAGEITGLVLTESALFGLWQILVSCYSNSNDIAGDRAVSRTNAATVFSPRGNQVFISALTALETGVIVGSAAMGLVPWWFPIALLPLLALRARQLRTFLSSGGALLARRRGVNNHRVGVATLILVNLVYLTGAGG